MTILGIFDCYLTLALSQAEMTGPKNNMIEKPMNRLRTYEHTEFLSFEHEKTG